jgi:NADPH-dependent 2,4-dienoyl-CoA reductase/sulfur reductase-like enzyme
VNKWPDRCPWSEIASRFSRRPRSIRVFAQPYLVRRCAWNPERSAALNRMDVKTLTTRCCIAGGGPAGVMLGFLLARAGVEVVVLEKHSDFLRDFRGDTHFSTR